jgi:hypothetical protein
MPLEKHPQGLPGWTAEMNARIAEDDAAIARYSAALAAKLRRQGRDAVAKFLADATKIRELTKSDRDELAKFLTSEQPGDIRVNDHVSSWSEGFVRFGAILSLLIPDNLVIFARFAPAIFLGAVWMVGLWSPIATTTIVICEFAMDSNLQTAMKLQSTGLTEIWQYTGPAYARASLPDLYWIVAILAVARIWRMRNFTRTIVLNIAIVAGVYVYAGMQISDLRANESKIPPYCNSHVNDKLEPPTLEQYKRSTPRQR